MTILWRSQTDFSLMRDLKPYRLVSIHISTMWGFAIIALVFFWCLLPLPITVLRSISGGKKDIGEASESVPSMIIVLSENGWAFDTASAHPLWRQIVRFSIDTWLVAQLTAETGFCRLMVAYTWVVCYIFEYCLQLRPLSWNLKGKACWLATSRPLTLDDCVWAGSLSLRIVLLNSRVILPLEGLLERSEILLV